MFRLGKYMNGTAAEIRQSLQGPVDEFTEKTMQARQRVADCQADISAATALALPRARGTAGYRELAAAATRAGQDLDRARRSGTAQQRIDAGTRLNRARAAMEKVEKDAIKNDPELALLETRLAEERESVARCDQSLEKATVSRDQWVYAIECTFRMNAPVEVGSQGVLTRVKVLEPDSAAHEGVLIEYEAAEQTGLGDVVEGIQTVNVEMKKVRLLLGPDTPGAENKKAGDVLELFRTYRVEGMTVDRSGPVYVAARHAADADALMAQVMPLRVEAPVGLKPAAPSGRSDARPAGAARRRTGGARPAH